MLRSGCVPAKHRKIPTNIAITAAMLPAALGLKVLGLRLAFFLFFNRTIWYLYLPRRFLFFVFGLEHKMAMRFVLAVWALALTPALQQQAPTIPREGLSRTDAEKIAGNEYVQSTMVHCLSDDRYSVHAFIQLLKQNTIFAAKFPTANSPCEIGTQVMAKWGGSNTYYPATIASVNKGK